MRIRLLKRTLLILTSLTLLSEKTLALDLIPQKSDFECLTRDQKEKIVNSFEENAACHDALAKTQPSPAAPQHWEAFGLVTVLGIVAGMIIAGQMRH